MRKQQISGPQAMAEFIKAEQALTKESAESKQNKRIGEYLVDAELLTPDKLYACLKEQEIVNDRLGLILVRNGFVTRADLLEAILATNPDQIHGEELFTARVPGEVLLELNAMIVAETPGNVFVATMNNEKQVELELSEYYPEAKIHFVATNYEKLDDHLHQIREMTFGDDSLDDRLLRRAFAENVSDIHIVPRFGSYTVFFRHLGVRRHVHEGDLDEYNKLAARIKDRSRMDLAERRIPQDGGFNMEYNGKLVDLRVASSPTVNGEYIVIRLLDPDRVHPSLNKLGISRVEEWRKGVSRPNGICLICGPTGSGKSTTLNASQKEMDRFANAIFALEDPVEYRLAYTGQVNINHALGLDFARGLRAFMRADPDTIILGEIRDPETARNAVKAGETGHLVLGTLHTNDVPSAINRLRDLDVPANELVYLIRSVLVQNLIRTICKHCHGDGCQVCSGTGYSGRTIVSECVYFKNDKEVRDMMNGERWWPTMLDDAILKMEEGVTDAKEVIRLFGEEAKERVGHLVQERK